jgi:DNA-binding transcriptional ArsR family regulator/predicted nucleotidyltransferase
MKIIDPLNKILNNETKVKILRFLVRAPVELNGRQIAKEVGVSPATVHKALRELEEERVLTLRSLGNNHIYSLNQSNAAVSRMLKPLFEQEEKILDDIITIITKQVSCSDPDKHVISMSIFGSISARADRPSSDIDLCVIVDGEAARTKVEKMLDKAADKISETYGNVLSPYINTRAEFLRKHKDGLAVIKNIIKTHTAIYGKRIEDMI